GGSAAIPVTVPGVGPFRPIARAAPAASGGWRTALTSRPAGRRAAYRGLSFDGWISPERLYCVSSSAQDGQDQVGGERLYRVITAHLAHDVTGPAQLVAQEDLHLAAHRAHLLLGHA